MVPSPRKGWGLVALSMVLATGNGQNDDGPKNIPSVKNFLRRSGGTAAIIGDYVYYDGGELSQVPFSTPTYKQFAMNATISIDLSRSWDPSTLEMTEITKPPTPLNRQAMLVDSSNDAFYIWGGAIPGGSRLVDPALWKFTADGSGGGSWSDETSKLSNRPVFEQLDRVQGPASVSTSKRGYIFGGLSDRDTSPEPKSRIVGHVALDFEDQTWTQNSTAPYSSTGSFFGGSALHVPEYGKEGIIVLLGGTYDGSSKYNDFVTINILDVETGQWHKQETSGPGGWPSDRALHCATGVAGNGTYEIFLYGGEIRNSRRSYSDMYVLSLPGFEWTRLAPSRSPPARRDHMCLTVGKRQMLSLGGLNTADGPGGSMWLEKDPFPQGVGIFDMATLQWTDGYDAGASAYETHESIRKFYDDGGMSRVNWNSSEVETLFATQASSTPPSGGGGEDSSAGDGDSTSASSGPPVGAIAGGVVGGVVGLALVGGLVWFLLRKKRKQGAMKGSPATDVTYASTGTEGYYPQQKTYANPDAYKYQQHGGELDGHSPRPEMQGESGRYEVPSDTAPVEMPDTSRR
ncbi:kelch repeat protein [Plectosphaerella plurivora]|uniref:Kelch repeat protein n=1 Tax=Plectosphaerella plurivora TaxID=936078 RepID=A0A9P8VDK2_9PEZI|nr:kelch repeat protein [Plectosphaerella plurivora]